MILASLMLAGTLASGGLAVPVQNNMPQACFVYGEVFWSPVQITAILSSNCRIHIERQERMIIMKGQNRIIRVLIPEEPGLHEFIYRWGQSAAHFDDELVQVASFIGGGLEKLFPAGAAGGLISAPSLPKSPLTPLPPSREPFRLGNPAT